MGDLVPGEASTRTPVVRHVEQQVFSTPEGVTRRVLRDDRMRGFEIAVNEYVPGGRSAETKLHHGGYECGVVLEGVLTVEVQGSSYVLEPGDSIAYESTRPHRIVNEGTEPVRALWVNLDRS
jgi:mannose-6-phosphate isomerase-like protein (cupin superfamily)